MILYAMVMIRDAGQYDDAVVVLDVMMIRYLSVSSHDGDPAVTCGDNA